MYFITTYLDFKKSNIFQNISISIIFVKLYFYESFSFLSLTTYFKKNRIASILGLLFLNFEDSEKFEALKSV